MTSLYTAARYKSEAHRIFRADGYVTKPLDFNSLAQLLERVAA
jgi:hypothetical protein